MRNIRQGASMSRFIFYAPVHFLDAPTWKRRSEETPPPAQATVETKAAERPAAPTPQDPATRGEHAPISEAVEDPTLCPEIPAIPAQMGVVRVIPVGAERSPKIPETERSPHAQRKKPHPQIPHLDIQLINPLWEFPATAPSCKSSEREPRLHVPDSLDYGTQDMDIGQEMGEASTLPDPIPPTQDPSTRQ